MNMVRNKKILLIMITSAILGLAGCQSKTTITTDNQTIVIPKYIHKIVVMNYGALDTLDALGKGSLVAATPQSVIPSYLEQYKNNHVIDTGNMKEPNIEVIKQTHPDLIIIDGRQASKKAELSKIAPVLNLSVDSNHYFESTKNHINLLATITGTENTAAQLIESLNNKINQAQTITLASPKKAIVAIHNNGKMILINNSSSATLIHDVLKVKRAVPLLANQPTTSGERPAPTFVDDKYIKTVKPDIIFVIDRSHAIGQQAIKADYFDAKVLNKSKTSVVYLTSDLWYLSGGGAESLERQVTEVTNAFNN